MKTRFLPLLTALSVLTPVAYGAELVGKAVDINTGELLYTEKHKFSSVDGKTAMTSTYASGDDEVIASRVVRYDDQARVSDYQLNLISINYRESIVREDGSLTFTIAEPGYEPQRETISLKPQKQPVIDAGINDFMKRNWTALTNGERLRFYFASAAQKDLVRLQVQQDRNLSTDEMVMFTMTAANPIFRLLVKPVKVGFYRDSRQLAYYRGISNLKDDDNKAYQVEITFDDNQLGGLDHIAQK